MKRTCLLLAFVAGAIAAGASPPEPGPWTRVFCDEFEGTAADLDAAWEFQNGPSGHILASRWRENAVLSNGVLRLVARREKRGGQDWTAASLWTRRGFRYGWFECRYRYLPAPGANNSFWIMTRALPRDAQRFEIDINEGHFPDEVNMNLHNWSGKHWARGSHWLAGAPKLPPPPDPGFSVVFDAPVRATQLRLVSDDTEPVRIMELRAFAPRPGGYPAPLSAAATNGTAPENLAAGGRVEASSTLRAEYGAGRAVDGRLGTASRWVSKPGGGPHTLTVTFDGPREIGCVQLVSGWQQGGEWRDVVRSFRIEARDGGEWIPLPGAARVDVPRVPGIDLSREFHEYALLWTERELVYHFDGRAIHRTTNDVCHGEAPVFLSLAIMEWAGKVTDALDGKSMDVDWVRVWQRPAAGVGVGDKP